MAISMEYWCYMLFAAIVLRMLFNFGFPSLLNNGVSPAGAPAGPDFDYLRGLESQGMITHRERIKAIRRVKELYLVTLDAAGPVFPPDNPAISNGQEHVAWHVDLNDFWGNAWSDSVIDNVPVVRSTARNANNIRWNYIDEMPVEGFRWAKQEWHQLVHAVDALHWRKVGQGRSACYRQLDGAVCEMHRWEARLRVDSRSASSSAGHDAKAPATAEIADLEQGKKHEKEEEEEEKEGELVGRLQCWNADYEYMWDVPEWGHIGDGTVCVLEVRGGVSDQSVEKYTSPQLKLQKEMVELSPQLATICGSTGSTTLTRMPMIKLLYDCVWPYMKRNNIYKQGQRDNQRHDDDLVYFDQTLREIFQRNKLPISSLLSGLAFSPHTSLVYAAQDKEVDEETAEHDYTDFEYLGGIAVVGSPVDHAQFELSQLKFDHSHGENGWILNFSPNSGGTDDARTIVRQMSEFNLRILSEISSEISPERNAMGQNSDTIDSDNNDV